MRHRTTCNFNDRMTDNPQHKVRTKTAEQALRSLMWVCARAEKSSGDAMRLMRTWGVPEADREGVLEKLIDQKFIDDERFAMAYVREKSRLSGWGEHRIRRMLASKNVDREVIDKALEQIEGQGGEQLEQMLKRKLKSAKAANDYELRGKLLRYGLGLGHEYDDVITAITKIFSK